MPYGQFRNNRHFMKGVRLYHSVTSGALEFESPEDILNYIREKHGPKAEHVIRGLAVESFKEGVRIAGRYFLQHLQDNGHDVTSDPVFMEVANNAHELGTLALKRNSGRVVKNKTDYGLDPNEFLAGQKIKT